MPFRRESRILFLAVALPVWLVLVTLLSPTVTRGGDCGELITASYQLGIGHPSGYPVWCLLGRLFAMLPLGEVAWRYNLFSSLCGALASGFIALAAFRVALALALAKAGVSTFDPDALDRGERWWARWAGWGTGCLFAGSIQVGLQFVLAEVYSGAALVGAALLYFSLCWHQERDRRDLFTLALLGGLSLAVHLSVIFLLPWVALAACWKRGLGRAHFGWIVAFALLGFSPVLYLPIRSAPFPAPAATDLNAYFYAPLDWGHPSNVAAFKNHVTAAQYRKLLISTRTRVENGRTVTTRELAQSPRVIPQRLATLGQFILMDYLWATPLLLVGLIAIWKADRRIFWLLLLITVGNIGVEINYDVGDQSDFFFPAYLAMALWMGAGWFVTLRFLAKFGSLAAKLGPIFLLATVLPQWGLFAPHASLRRVTRVRDGALEQTRAAQQLATRTRRPVAVISAADDVIWAFWYAKYVLGTAPDVETPWGRKIGSIYRAKKLVSYVAQLRKRGPVCLGVWLEDVDARFPLVMLSPSGNLCLASNRRLPPPAVPLSIAEMGNASSTSAPNGLLSGRFRRADLWRSFDRPELGSVPSLSISDTAAFEVDFSVPGNWRRAREDRVGGRIEVLMAPTGHFAKTPRPTQGNVFEGQSSDKTQVVILQRRRLVLPTRAAPRQLLRATVPLNVETTALAGFYTVWTRLVLPGATTLPAWTRTDRVYLTQK